MRIVDADNIKDIICRITNDAIEKNQTKATIQKRLIMAVEKMPTLDVRKDTQGEWEHFKGKTLDCAVCSNCKRGFPLIYMDYNFCPNCGANMGGNTDVER